MRTVTVRELTDEVIASRRGRVKADATAIVATGKLNPEDEELVRRVVSEAGYAGQELEDMVTQVSARVVGQVQAFADRLPAEGGD
jgi:hypothetical protein